MFIDRRWCVEEKQKENVLWVRAAGDTCPGDAFVPFLFFFFFLIPIFRTEIVRGGVGQERENKNDTIVKE